jgi:hypothetical protein
MNEGPKQKDNEGGDRQNNIHPFQTQVLTYRENKKFWEELIVYFPLIRHGPHRKQRVQQFFYCCVYLLPRERLQRAVA